MNVALYIIFISKSTAIAAVAALVEGAHGIQIFNIIDSYHFDKVTGSLINSSNSFLAWLISFKANSLSRKY